MEYASNSKGNLGVTLGAIGTGLGALSGTGLLSGFSGMSGNYVTKDEIAMVQQLSAKDSEIALLKAESDSEKKMIDSYRQARDEIVARRENTNASIKELQKEINQNRRDQDAWNTSQSVLNSQISSAITTNVNSIAALQNTVGQITMTKIPNSVVCPGWGDIKVVPTMCSCNGTTLA